MYSSGNIDLRNWVHLFNHAVLQLSPIKLVAH